MRSARDEAVVLATSLFRKLFERVWFPWSPPLERAVARLVDLIIAAAVEQLQRQQDEDFLNGLIAEQDQQSARGGRAYTGDTIRTSRMTRRLDDDYEDERGVWREAAERAPQRPPRERRHGA